MIVIIYKNEGWFKVKVFVLFVIEWFILFKFIIDKLKFIIYRIIRRIFENVL